MSDSEAFDRCMAVGGVAVFPADTVYGLACDPDNKVAVDRLYALKRRDPRKPSAVMFFDLSLAFDALPELGERTRDIFILARLENMQHREIAAMYGISVSAVEKSMLKAMAHLGALFLRP